MGLYLLCLAGLVAIKVATFSVSFVTGAIACTIAHFLLAIVLARFILRDIQWHQQHSTLASVAGAKWGAIVAWPIAYPILFAQIAVVRYL